MTEEPPKKVLLIQEMRLMIQWAKLLLSDSPYYPIKYRVPNGDLVNVCGLITIPLINPEYKENIM